MFSHGTYDSLLVVTSETYRIAGNVREVQIFAIFVTHDKNAKIRTAK